MRINLSPTTTLKGPYCATIGFFDGVHRGHQYLIDSVKAQAHELGISSMAITFDVHPRQILTPSCPPELLTTSDERLDLLESTGIDAILVVPFSLEMSRLTSDEFIHQVMLRVGVSHLVLGYDNRFGSDRAATFADYSLSCQHAGIDLRRAEPLIVDNEAISSSRIRRLLQQGDVKAAASLLGRSYSIAGTVEQGYREGRRMGFPTANISPDKGKAIPQRGVYATRSVCTTCPDGTPSMTNIGIRPTFSGHRQTIETHLIGFSGDIYGQRLRVEFVDRLRDERHFGSEESLAEQLGRDRQQAIQTCFTSLASQYEGE